MQEASAVTEKRQSPRVKASIPIRYRVVRDGVEVADVGAVTCDVSTGGLRFFANELFSTACHLILELDIPAMTKPIKAVSEVAWVQKANEGDDCRYYVGSRFMEITEKDRALIAKYVGSL